MFLTKRQKQIFDYISHYVAAHGYAPTLEEIGAHFGLSSPATVYKHVQQLVRKGHLRKAKHQGRGLELVDREAKRTIVAPLRGDLCPGRPVEETPGAESVSLPGDLDSASPLYVLRIRGDAMRDEMLQDGDLLVLEERSQARDGETIVALLQDERTEVGRYSRERGLVRLQRGPGTTPVLLPEEQVRVRGVVVAMLRRYR